MRSETAQPCSGSSERVRRMSRSSVPCGRPTDRDIALPLLLLQEATAVLVEAQGDSLQGGMNTAVLYVDRSIFETIGIACPSNCKSSVSTRFTVDVLRSREENMPTRTSRWSAFLRNETAVMAVGF